MTEKPTEKSIKKKIPAKTLTLVLGLVCIILGAGIVAIFAMYSPKISDLESELAEKDMIISSLTTQIGSLSAQVISLQNSLNQSSQLYADMEAQITSLLSQVYQLESRLRLEEYGILVNNKAINQDANASSIIWSSELGYAGFVIIEVESSSNSTYAEVMYLFEGPDSFGIDYFNRTVVRESGVTGFPILPGYVEIRIGNTDTVGSVNATVTATYYY